MNCDPSNSTTPVIFASSQYGLQSLALLLRFRLDARLERFCFVHQLAKEAWVGRRSPVQARLVPGVLAAAVRTPTPGRDRY